MQRWLHRCVSRNGAMALALSSLSGALPSPQSPATPDPGTTLAVQQRGHWTTWWSSARAPSKWSGSLPHVAHAVTWRRAVAGMETGELQLSGDGTAWRLRVSLVRFDARRLRFSLDTLRTSDGAHGAWSIDAAQNAAVAFNAGQFRDATPWGWLVLGGHELQPPGVGPLSTAILWDSTGVMELVAYDSIASVRAARVAERGGAFQSYPTLLSGDGDVPEQLMRPGLGVDLEHRDTRLAICSLRDGRTLVALTRFGALGEALGALPFGPTIPELAAIMGALGCRRAVALDGGLSGQLLVRDASGRPTTWHGMRSVPLGFIGVVRQ